MNQLELFQHILSAILWPIIQISATFETAVYSISASSGAGGSVSPSGTISATYGTSRTFTITPATGYRISDVKVDNNSVGVSLPIHFQIQLKSFNICNFYHFNIYSFQPGRNRGIN